MLLARYDESPADTHYYHHDGLGSVIGMTNENGLVEQSYFYDDFGNSLGSWGNVGNHYLYTGQEYDGTISGLYNLRARYYDPGVGRFVSEDPIGVDAAGPQTLNRYRYVSNNPMNWTDITGLSVICYPIVTIPGVWRDAGEPILLGKEYFLIAARLGGIVGEWHYQCFFKVYLKYLQPRWRSSYVIELCIRIEFCVYEMFMKGYWGLPEPGKPDERLKFLSRTTLTGVSPIPYDPEDYCWKLVGGRMQ